LLKRVKRRYIALTVDSAESCKSGEFMDAVWNCVSKLYGEYGASRVSLSLISFDEEEKFGILRVNNAGVELVKATLAAMTKVGNKPAAVHVLTVSGTLKALGNKLKH